MFTFGIDKCTNLGKGPAFRSRIYVGMSMWNTLTFECSSEKELIAVRGIDCLAEKQEHKGMEELFRFKWEKMGGLLNIQICYKRRFPRPGK